MEFVPIRPEHDAAMAKLVRDNLKAAGLDIPGTAYFDEGLDRLSGCYESPGRAYYVLMDGGRVIGGVGFAEFDGDPGCCEMQKLYLDDAYKGRGIGHRMVGFIEQKAREAGYRRIYLETHTNLKAAIRLYEKSGYRAVERPASVIHSTMDRFYLREL